jgi:hypothetical protein
VLEYWSAGVLSAKKDTITRLPTDPKKLEAYFKTLPPEVIEGFAQNALKEGEKRDDSEMAKLITETILRLAWVQQVRANYRES